MSTPLKLGSYLLGLVAVFALALWIGTMVGPVLPAQESEPMEHSISYTPQAPDGTKS